MHYTYSLKSSTSGWSHSPYIERQNSSWSWMERSWGYSIWPGHVESADCSSGSKSAWHWPLGGDTHSLPQRPQTGEETLFGSGQRVSVCWHVSSRVRTHEPTLIQTGADFCVRTPTHTLCPLSPTCTPKTCTPEWVRAEEERGAEGKDELSLRCLTVMAANEQLKTADLHPLTLNPVTMFRPQAGTNVTLLFLTSICLKGLTAAKWKTKCCVLFTNASKSIVTCIINIYLNIFCIVSCFRLPLSGCPWTSAHCCTEHTPWPQLTPQLGSVLWMNETVYITSQNHKNQHCIWLKEL